LARGNSGAAFRLFAHVDTLVLSVRVNVLELLELFDLAQVILGVLDHALRAVA